MSKMTAESKTPAIRFMGFSGEWEEKIIGDIVKLENGFAFKSKHFKAEPTNVIVLTPGSVNVGGGFQEGKGQYYDEKEEVPIRYIFKSGDIFITMTDLTPTAQALGFPAIVPNDANTYLHNQRLGKLVDYQGDNCFLFHFFCTPKKQKEVVQSSSGTTVKHTSPAKFLNRFSRFPSVKEQTQIGELFQQLDRLIAQHQQKHDKLLTVKKALLEKMFPQQGKTQPAIRFKGFSEAWEEKTLIKVSQYRNGKAHENIIDEKGRFIVVNSKFVSSNGSVKKFSSVQIEPLLKNEIALVLSDVPNGKAIARTFLITENNLFTLNQRIAGITPSIKSSPYFLHILLNRNPYFLRFDDGAKQTNLSKEDVEKFFSLFPVSREQTKIGHLFQQLDTLINQHQTQLTKMNHVKQSLLAKMFV